LKEPHLVVVSSITGVSSSWLKGVISLMKNPIKIFIDWSDSRSMQRIDNLDKARADLEFCKRLRVIMVVVVHLYFIFFLLCILGFYELMDWGVEPDIVTLLFFAFVLNWLQESILFREYVLRNKKH